MEDLEQSVATHLNSIGLDHEEVLYVSAMLTDEDQETEEVEELVKGYLEAAAESADEEEVDKVVAVLMSLREEYIAGVRRSEEEKAAERIKAGQQDELRQAEQETRKEKVSVKMSREERKQREALLATYGFETDVVQEDGTVVIKNDKSKGGTSGIAENMNSKVVAMKEQEKREKSKQAHQEKVRRDKELLERQQAAKDKEKKRTQKREKRRGCG